MKMNKVLSAALAVAMVATMGTSVFAAPLTAENLANYESMDEAAQTITIGGVASVYNTYEDLGGTDASVAGDASSVVVVNTDATNFKVTVPFALRINMAADATITTPDSMDAESDGAAKIINESASGAAKIETVKVVGNGTWTIADWEDDFANKKVNTTEFGMKINGVEVEEDGSLNFTATNDIQIASVVKDSAKEKSELERVYSDYESFTETTFDATAADGVHGAEADHEFPVIENGSVLPIEYDGKLPARSSAIADEVVGGVIFTVSLR